MSRQHSTPLLIAPGGGSATPLVRLSGEAHGFDEAAVQTLIHAHPAVLPVAEIDPIFADPVPICRELNTPAGSVDNLLVSPAGLPVLVECKLWRNPQARREVVGQILDYAKELRRWTASDLQREVSRRVPGRDNPVLELLREAGHAVDEVTFTDALTHNLRRGRFLLLIVGDGIREGVEAIAEYLGGQAGLHFTLGLVELPIYAAPDGGRLVVPRVLARTTLITREVVAVPEGYQLQEEAGGGETADGDEEVSALSAERQAFWAEFLSGLNLDDPEQAVPDPFKLGYLTFSLPAPGPGWPHSGCWLTVYRFLKDRSVGVSLSGEYKGMGDQIVRAVADDWPAIREELGGTVMLKEKRGRPFISDHIIGCDLDSAEGRAEAFAWLRGRTNDFVNAFRPRVRAAADQLAG